MKELVMGVQLSKGGAVHLEVVTPESKTLCGRDSSNGEVTDDNVSCKSCLNAVAKLHVKAEMAQETEASVERNRRIVARATAETLHVQTEELAEKTVQESATSYARFLTVQEARDFAQKAHNAYQEAYHTAQAHVRGCDTCQEGDDCPEASRLEAQTDHEYSNVELTSHVLRETYARVQGETFTCATCGPNATAQCAWCYRVPATLRMNIGARVDVTTETVQTERGPQELIMWFRVINGKRFHFSRVDEGATVVFVVLTEGRVSHVVRVAKVPAAPAAPVSVRPYVARGGKRKGCKADRRRSNSRIGRGVRV